MKTQTAPLSRAKIYALVALLLLGSGVLLPQIHWQGSVELHTLLESLATLLAFMVGAMALVRYFSQRDNQFLYIGSGFLGTALLDAYHTLVTSRFFLAYMPTAYQQLTPWSWFASRFFLSVMLFVSWLLWHKQRHEPHDDHQPQWVFSITGLSTLLCFLMFSLVPMPTTTVAVGILHRPFELLPASFFLLALLGYLRKGAWRYDAFEHWLVLSLLVGLATQTVFMPFSDQLHDTEFNIAHLAKKLSYLLVLTGLMVSLFKTYQILKEETEQRILAENKLRLDAEKLLESERWFRAIADHTYDWETWISPSGNMLYSNPACERITGYSATLFISGDIKIEQLLSPHERISTARHFSAPSDSAKEEFDFRIITEAGEERWINHVCRPIHDQNGCFIGRRASNRDITERKLAELENQALLVALHSAPVGVVITNAQGIIEYVNPKFVEITGYAQAEVVGKNPRILKSDQHSPEFYQHFWDTLSSGVIWSGEIRNKRRDGSLYWEYAAISPVLDSDGNIKKYVAVKQDITEKKKLEQDLYQKANFDALTGLPNRVLFHDRLQQTLKKTARNGNTLALLMLDLDKFKDVNDTLGHDAGDELLKQAAERMQRCVRDSDTVARLGGDEFIILVESYPLENRAEEIAQRLIDELKRPFTLFNHSGEVSASIGLAFLSPTVNDAEALKKNADIALYQAKQRGRNRVVRYTE